MLSELLDVNLSTIHSMTFENVVCNMLSILFKPQCVTEDNNITVSRRQHCGRWQLGDVLRAPTGIVLTDGEINNITVSVMLPSMEMC